MKNIAIIIISIFALSAVSRAQEVYREGNKVILDMSVAAGMPIGASTTQSKTSIVAGSPSNTGKLRNNDYFGLANQKVYHKLEIALGNLDADGNFTTIDDDVKQYTWENAYRNCRRKGWRLPTQREGIMIIIFEKALDSVLSEVGGLRAITANTSGIWTMTEFDHSNAFCICGPTNGRVESTGKIATLTVRCVREIP